MARGVAELSVQAVSRESGVSRPTVYRYFKNKAEMIEAVGRLYAERLGLGDEGQPARTLDELLDRVGDVFARAESLDEGLRAAVWSHQGKALRSGSYRARRLEAARRILVPACRGMTKEDRERVARVVTVLCSSGVRQAFHDYLGLSSADAAEDVVWTIRQLTKRGTR